MLIAEVKAPPISSVMGLSLRAVWVIVGGLTRSSIDVVVDTRLAASLKVLREISQPCPPSNRWACVSSTLTKLELFLFDGNR